MPNAQAGLEYLMTYGWALILIAAVVGVLVFAFSAPPDIYFTSSAPNKLMVKGGAISGSDVVVKLQNITGGRITVTSVSLSEGFVECTDDPNGATLNQNSIRDIRADNPVIIPSGSPLDFACIKYFGTGNGTITISYKDQFNLEREIVVTVTGHVNKPGPEPACGDGACNPDETCVTCFADCPDSPCCGNGTAELGEACDLSDLGDMAGKNVECRPDCQSFNVTDCELLDKPHDFYLQNSISGVDYCIGITADNANLYCEGGTITSSGSTVSVGGDNAIIDGCTVLGSADFMAGIIVSGSNVTVSNNNVTLTGISVTGLFVAGLSPKLLNNTIDVYDEPGSGGCGAKMFAEPHIDSSGNVCGTCTGGLPWCEMLGTPGCSHTGCE